MYRPIMFNEEIDSKKIYENGFTNKEYNFHESVLVAKYLRHVLGYGDAKIKTALKEFCNTKSKFFVEVLNLTNIKRAVSRSRRDFVNKSNPIGICQSEIDTIKNLEGYKQKKVLFSILVLAKLNNGFVNNTEWNNIRRMLHSKITNKEISFLMFKYSTNNLLYPTSNESHKILFIDKITPPSLFLSSELVNNLNKTFEKIFGKDLFKCEDCKKEGERKSYNQKRCHNCSKKKEKENWKIRQKRHREQKSHDTREL